MSNVSLYNDKSFTFSHQQITELEPPRKNVQIDDNFRIFDDGNYSSDSEVWTLFISFFFIFKFLKLIANFYTKKFSLLFSFV